MAEPLDWYDGPVRYLRNSMLETLGKCPRQFEFRYVQGLVRPATGAQFLGTIWHQTVEHNLRQKLVTQADLSEEEMLTTFSDQWETARQVEEINWENDRPEALKSIGLRLTRDYHRAFAHRLTPAENGVELEFAVDLGQHGRPGWEFRGRIDLITARGTIVDHKTSRKPYSQRQVDNAPQATAYWWAYRELFGRDPFGFRYCVAVKQPGWPEESTQTLTTERSNRDVQHYIGLVGGVIDIIERGEFAPLGLLTEACRWCPYFQECRGPR